jgi:hypothetical protein
MEQFYSSALSNQIKNGTALFSLPNVEWNGSILRNWNGTVSFNLALQLNRPYMLKLRYFMEALQLATSAKIIYSVAAHVHSTVMLPSR